MSSEEGGSKFAILAAVLGNLLVAVSKFIAAALTGSSAMVAEGIHSLVDTGNGGLVLLGMRRSAEPADAEHPFGHGKELYFWTLIVAISIFGIGGGMSVYEGVLHLLQPVAVENPWPNYLVLAIAAVLEGSSFVVAMREFGHARGTRRAFEFIRASKDPSLFTVVFEDSAALLGLLVAFVGVLLGQVTGSPYFDGVASVLIGLILMGVAWLLARESKGLLVGEGVEPGVLAGMRAIVGGDPAVEAVGDVRTMYLGPHDLLVNLDVAFRAGSDTVDIRDSIDRIESDLKSEYPDVTRVYIEVASLRQATASEQG
jgi:cation diffusion facilitator family transporter